MSAQRLSDQELVTGLRAEAAEALAHGFPATHEFMTQAADRIEDCSDE